MGEEGSKELPIFAGGDGGLVEDEQVDEIARPRAGS
jgi:hypothetical protein